MTSRGRPSTCVACAAGDVPHGSIHVGSACVMAVAPSTHTPMCFCLSLLSSLYGRLCAATQFAPPKCPSTRPAQRLCPPPTHPNSKDSARLLFKRRLSLKYSFPMRFPSSSFQFTRDRHLASVPSFTGFLFLVGWGGLSLRRWASVMYRCAILWPERSSARPRSALGQTHTHTHTHTYTRARGRGLGDRGQRRPFLDGSQITDPVPCVASFVFVRFLPRNAKAI